MIVSIAIGTQYAPIRLFKCGISTTGGNHSIGHKTGQYRADRTRQAMN